LVMKRLSDNCPKCGIPLMRNQQGENLCISCIEKPHYENSKKGDRRKYTENFSTEEGKSFSMNENSGVEDGENRDSKTKQRKTLGLHLHRDLQEESTCASRSILYSTITLLFQKMEEWQLRLKENHDIDQCKQICALLGECGNTLNILQKLKEVIGD